MPSSTAIRNGEGERLAGSYQRHRPEQTLLYRIVDEHYPAFTAHLAEQGRELPGYVQREFGDYLQPSLWCVRRSVALLLPLQSVAKNAQ